MTDKAEFTAALLGFVETLKPYVSSESGEWTVKGFIDIFENVYTISADTKIVSKILEIHLFPQIVRFARDNGYKVVLADHQNYYPDISFVKASDESVRFAVDFKTTYRKPEKPHLCNGFTLGSHGAYFENRQSTKNIQFPYSTYSGHFCLGIIYDRRANATIDETKAYRLDELQSIHSVVSNFQFFAAEKWRIASDTPGSGNTANIGSINNIVDVINGRGLFSQMGESWFDDYWMNYKKITQTLPDGTSKKITKLDEFVAFRGGDPNMIVRKRNGEE